MKFGNRLVLFARTPRAGMVKHRLAAGIGVTAATSFYRRMLDGTARRLAGDPRWRTCLAVTPDRDAAWPGPWPPGVPRVPQGPGDLGQRMSRVMHGLPPGPVVIVGTDIPGLHATHVADAFHALGNHDAVFGPATDGGYWLVGLKRRPAVPEIFDGVRWSTEHALDDTLANLRAGRRVKLLETLADVDEADDYFSIKRGMSSTKLHGLKR